MGFKHAKYMLIIICVVTFITNVFANIPQSSVNYLNQSSNDFKKVFDYDTGHLNANTSAALTKWIENETISSDDSTFDFMFKSITWVKDFVVAISQFLGSPYFLVDSWVTDDVRPVLYWLPPLVGFIWVMMYGLAIFQIWIGE